MNIKKWHTFSIGTLLLLAVALLGAGFGQGYLALAAPGPAPGIARQAASLPAETCTYDGPTNTRTCELWATTGTLSLAGASMPFWGYAAADPLSGGAAELPGPALIANQGEILQVILHNNLAEATALNFHGQAMIPDLAGVAAGGSTTYTFTASQPGTYLYEAGSLPNAQHQAALGMFGALIVRPAGAPNQAYAGGATVFDDETLVVLSEVDPALNNSGNPADFDMRDYTPRYWLINGQVYPDIDPIPTSAGSRVLLRYINAGLEPHTMNLLGLDQTLLGTDGSPLPYSRKVVVNTIAPGQTADALAAIPAATLDGTQLALYDGTFLLHNNGAAGFGGMLTFFDVGAAGPGTGGAPTTSNVVVSPSPTNGLVDVTVTADVVVDTSVITTNIVTAAEYFIDVRGADGAGRAMGAADGAFDAANEGVTATLLAADVAALSAGTHTIYAHGQDSTGLWGAFATATFSVDKSGPTTGPVSLSPNPADETLDVSVTALVTDPAGVMAAEFYINATSGTPYSMTLTATANPGEYEAGGTIGAAVDLAALATGDYTIYVRGQNAAGLWGAFNFAMLHLDKDGPTIKALTLTPNPSSGNVDVALSATGDDSASGDSNIQAAEYFIDAAGADGTGTAMTVNVAAPIASLNATIPAGLAAGTYTVYVHSQDAFDHWGGFATIDLIVSQTGPTTTNVTVAPSPNNGSLPINPSQLSVRVDAAITAAAGTVKAAEGFIDTVGADGSGFPMTPNDGLFNSPVENAYAFIPLPTINQLPEGPHPIWVHGRDSSDNWGAVSSTTLVIDKTAPTVDAVSASPNPTDDTQTTTLTASASDASSNIVMAEWFDGADPGQGNGTPMPAADGAFDSLAENLAATIDVTLWAAGDHTLSVRARDAAGNWSAVVPYVLSVVKPDAIFADSFGSGDLAAWNGGVVGPVSVAAQAAMDGDGFGMAVTMAGNTPGFVTDLTPVLDANYHARFYFNPNSALTGNNQAYTILAGLDAANATILRVQFRRQNQAGGTYQIRASALSGGAFANTNWFTISNNAPHWIEIAWASGTNTTFELYIDSTTPAQSLTGLNTSANLLDAVSLGPSAGLVNAASGTLYFDAFVSTRTIVIGP
jgi:hypothetical protein